MGSRGKPPSFHQMCCYSNLGQIGGFDLTATTPGGPTLFFLFFYSLKSDFKSHFLAGLFHSFWEFQNVFILRLLFLCIIPSPELHGVFRPKCFASHPGHYLALIVSSGSAYLLIQCYLCGLHYFGDKVLILISDKLDFHVIVYNLKNTIIVELH